MSSIVDKHLSSCLFNTKISSENKIKYPLMYHLGNKEIYKALTFVTYVTYCQTNKNTDTLHQKQCLISPFTLAYQYNAHIWCLKA